MTDEEVKKMLNRTLYIFGLDAPARFYACYLWWKDGEQAAEEWMGRYLVSNWGPIDKHPNLAGWNTRRKAREEMERFFRKEQPNDGVRLEIPVMTTLKRAADYQLNYRIFEADARFHVAMQMLELAGFPARSEAFAELARKALEKISERDRTYYLAYRGAQAPFQKKKQELEGDRSEKMATEAKQ
jgi:hypothetical protein